MSSDSALWRVIEQNLGHFNAHMYSYESILSTSRKWLVYKVHCSVVCKCTRNNLMPINRRLDSSIIIHKVE